MADKPHKRDDKPDDETQEESESKRVPRSRQKDESERSRSPESARLVAIDAEPQSQSHPQEGAGKRFQRTVTDRHERMIRSTPPVYRWVCPCQDPPVLLATYGPNARINIKVRDRYWHLQGFGMVEAICPRCAAEHMLDMRLLRHALGDADRASSIDHDDSATGD